MRLTQKAVTAELHRLGHEARLESGDGYFYFLGLEPANWLDKTVKVPKVSSLTLEQWVAEYERLKKLNEDIVRGPVGSEPAPAPELCVPSQPNRNTNSVRVTHTSAALGSNLHKINRVGH